MNLENLPTEEDFDYFDVDKDGLLLFSEWEQA